MKAIYAIAGSAVLGLGLAGWAALARGQTDQGGVTISPSQPGDTGTLVVLPPRNSTMPATLPPPGSLPPPSPRLNNVVVPVAPPTAPQTRVQSPPTPYGQGLPPRDSLPPPPRTGDEKPVAPPDAVGENSNGRQEPAVSIEWLGSPEAKIHQPTDYTLAVRNTSAVAVEQVVVRVRIPTGMSIVSCTPKGVAESNAHVWELGTLAPRQEKGLKIRLVGETHGEHAPQASVTFTGTSVLRMHVREPKLALKAQAPARVLLGDPATVVLTVTNPGDGPAEKVRIVANISESLEHSGGKQVEFDAGTLGPGESRRATLLCSPKTAGKHECEARVEAEGGLNARDRVTLSAVTPKLGVQATGPAFRYLERKALYTIRVHNSGDSVATNAVLTDMVPEGLKFLAASDGGQYDASARQVSWALGELGPGQAKDFRLELSPVAAGEQRQRIVVQAARGLKAECDVQTRVDCLSAILIDLADTDDPIEVGAETVYTVRILNTGSKAETDLKLVCTVPEKMEFKSAEAPCRHHAEGKNIIFDPLPKLAPRGEALFRIAVKGQAPGDVRFKVQVTSANLIEPIIRMESTRIYSDAP